MRRPVLFLAGTLFLAACGGEEPALKGPPTQPVAVPPPPALSETAPTISPAALPHPTVPMVPLRLVASNGLPFKLLELKADGTILSDGKPAGKIAVDHVEDASGRTILRITEG